MLNNKQKTPVGENIVTKCTKCKLLLDHVVIYHGVDDIVEKVKCLTCGSEHKYHPEKKKSSRPRAKKVDPAKDFALLTERFKGKKPLRYTMSGLFRAEDIIDHNIFGMGIVISAFHKQMEVVFSDQPRILVFDRQDLNAPG